MVHIYITFVISECTGTGSALLFGLVYAVLRIICTALLVSTCVGSRVGASECFASLSR